MVTKCIVPRLNIQDGRVVKEVNFQGFRNVSDPATLTEHYSRPGADELVFHDITTSREGRKLFTSILIKVTSAISIPLTVGGGIRGLDDFRRVLACGVDKVSVNSGAARNSVLIEEAARRYGDQCVAPSVDVKQVDGSYHVFLNGGRVDTGLDALEWACRGVDAGADEMVVNSMDTDGVEGSFDVELLRAVSRAVSIPAVVSDGAGSAADFAALFHVLPELSAGLTVSTFHLDEVIIPALKRALAGEEVRARLRLMCRR